MEIEISMLEGFGLSKAEIKVYIALLELGETKVRNIIEKSGLVSSAVHNALNILIEKGLVSYIKKGKIKYYIGAKPEQILNFIDEKKEQIKQLLPQLEAKRLKSRHKDQAEIFEGSSGMTAVHKELIDAGLKSDKEYLFFAIDIPYRDEKLRLKFESYDSERKKVGLVSKGISSIKYREYFSYRKNLKMKYAPFVVPESISICGDKTAIISWSERPLIILITSQQISKMYKKLFRQIWKSLK